VRSVDRGALIGGLSLPLHPLQTRSKLADFNEL
jgi:hypothetical protein